MFISIDVWRHDVHLYAPSLFMISGQLLDKVLVLGCALNRGFALHRRLPRLGSLGWHGRRQDPGYSGLESAVVKCVGMSYEPDTPESRIKLRKLVKGASGLRLAPLPVRNVLASLASRLPAPTFFFDKYEYQINSMHVMLLSVH